MDKHNMNNGPEVWPTHEDMAKLNEIAKPDQVSSAYDYYLGCARNSAAAMFAYERKKAHMESKRDDWVVIPNKD